MEQWDLFTKDRIRTGTVISKGESVPEGYFRMVVHVSIFNDKNQMLIQKRNSHKKLWPGLWDVSVGGSAITGESSSKAAARETFEELGIRLDEEYLRPAFTINFNQGFDDCYLVEKNIDIEDVVIKEDEVSDVRWATKEEILKMIDNGEFIDYHKSKIELMFFMRDHGGTHRSDKK